MSTELGHHITPAPENMRIMGPAEAPVPRLKAEYRYQLLIKSGSRKDLNGLLRKAQEFARERKWATMIIGNSVGYVLAVWLLKGSGCDCHDG
jgi:primosomal protein N' (replication factor Y)